MEPWILEDIIGHAHSLPLTVHWQHRYFYIEQFIKALPDSLILAMVSDTHHSMLAVFTPECVGGYETNHRARITENTLGALVGIHGELRFMKSNDALKQFALNWNDLRLLKKMAVIFCYGLLIVDKKLISDRRALMLVYHSYSYKRLWQFNFFQSELSLDI